MTQQKDDGVTAELRATATANPSVELQKAIQKRNLGFIGISGIGFDVPGVPDGPDNMVVKIRGIHTVFGSGCLVHSEEQLRLEIVAAKYAKRYNHLLLAYLVQMNDPAVVKIRRHIDQELARLERSDPRRDAEVAAKNAASRRFIEIPSDQRLILPGIDTKIIQSDSFNPITSTSMCTWELMTPVQRQRFDRQLVRYIIPYNRAIYAYYDTRKSKR